MMCTSQSFICAIVQFHTVNIASFTAINTPPFTVPTSTAARIAIAWILKKCKMGFEVVEYLGYLMGQRNIKVQKRKV
jgi:hypothetical protein